MLQYNSFEIIKIVTILNMNKFDYEEIKFNGKNKAITICTLNGEIIISEDCSIEVLAKKHYSEHYKTYTLSYEEIKTLSVCCECIKNNFVNEELETNKKENGNV